MVLFRDDIETFCKYVAHRPPNVDHIVHQHIEDRHLEAGMRGVHYVARYEHQPADGEAISVGLRQFCGRIAPDDDIGTDTAAAQRIDAAERRVLEATAMAGGAVHKGPLRYSGGDSALPQ